MTPLHLLDPLLSSHSQKQVLAAVVEILVQKSQFTLNWDLVPSLPPLQKNWDLDRTCHFEFWLPQNTPSQKIEIWTGLGTLSFDYPSLPLELQGHRMWRLISVSPVDTISLTLLRQNPCSCCGKSTVNSVG